MNNIRIEIQNKRYEIEESINSIIRKYHEPSKYVLYLTYIGKHLIWIRISMPIRNTATTILVR